MGNEICEICQYRSQLGAVGRYNVIPKELTQQAGMTETPTMRMCYNCRRELDTWYLSKVAKMVYDIKTQRFRDRTAREMVEEYQDVFNSFVDYKRKKNKVH